MPQDYVAKLVEIAGLDQARERPTPEDWEKVEVELNYQLPDDYKALINAIGTGTFGDDLVLFNPRGGEGDRLCAEDLIVYREVIKDLENQLSMRLFPRPGGSITIAGNSNSVDIQLIPKDDEKILRGLSILHVNLGVIETMDITVSEFIYKLYKNELSGPLAKRLHRSTWPRPDVPLFRSRRERNGRPIQ